MLKISPLGGLPGYAASMKGGGGLTPAIGVFSYIGYVSLGVFARIFWCVWYSYPYIPVCMALVQYPFHVLVYAISVVVTISYVITSFLEGNIQFVFTEFIVGIEVENDVFAFAAYGNNRLPVLQEGGFDNGHAFGLEVVCSDVGHELISGRPINSAVNRTLYSVIWPVSEGIKGAGCLLVLPPDQRLGIDLQEVVSPCRLLA